MVCAWYVAADDGLAVGKTSRQSRKDTEIVDRQQFSRQSHKTHSVRLSRSSYPRTSSMTSHGYHQSRLMQASLRMHRNHVLLNLPSTVKQSTSALPVPSDWTTVSSLRTRRRQDAPPEREDSYIVPCTGELHDTPVSDEPLKALPEPAIDVEEPLPTASVQPPSPPPVPIRHRRKPRRQTLADVDNNSLLIDDSGSRPSVSENKEPLPRKLSTALPVNVDKNETDVDSIMTESSARQCNLPTAMARRSLVFEKVPMDMRETIVKTRHHATDRRLPLQESSV